REAASKARCSNNLKQFCLAMHDYASARGHFPSAYTAPNMDPGWGWAAALLPFVEQDALYQALGVETTPFGGGANPAMPTPESQIRLSIFRCPTDLGPDTNPIRLDHSMSNYRAVAGPTTYPYFAVDQDMGGVMFQNSKIRPENVSDGTSNTLA